MSTLISWKGLFLTLLPFLTTFQPNWIFMWIFPYRPQKYLPSSKTWEVSWSRTGNLYTKIIFNNFPHSEAVTRMLSFSEKIQKMIEQLKTKLSSVLLHQIPCHCKLSVFFNLTSAHYEALLHISTLFHQVWMSQLIAEAFSFRSNLSVKPYNKATHCANTRNLWYQLERVKYQSKNLG